MRPTSSSTSRLSFWYSATFMRDGDAIWMNTTLSASSGFFSSSSSNATSFCGRPFV